MSTQKLLELMEERLKKKQKELNEKSNQDIKFRSMASIEFGEHIDSICQLQGQIQELEHWIDILKIQESIDKTDGVEDN